MLKSNNKDTKVTHIDFIDVVLVIITDTSCDLVLFIQFEKCENTHEEVLLFY